MSEIRSVAPSLTAADGAQMTFDEFKGRFVARLVQLAGDTDPDGDSNSEYAAGVAESYWEDRDEFDSPEEAAEVDFSYWEAE